MIKDKLIEKYKELVKFYEKKLSMGEIHSAWEFRKAIAELEKQAEESSKGAEEILKEKYANDKWEPNFKGILEAMEQYRAEGLRKELIRFLKWHDNKFGSNGGDKIIAELIDEYIQYKKQDHESKVG
jgi:hypothetical protein